MVTRHFIQIIAFLTLFVNLPVLALSSVTASIDRNPVTLHESFMLTVIANDDVSSNQLNTSSLQESFIVGRTSVSNQTSMVNFKTTRSTKWTTILIPKVTGTVIIPSFTIEDHHTQPISLTVLEKNNSQANKQQDIFITTKISSHDVYVQQLVTLNVKLHFSADLKRGMSLWSLFHY